jgi:hypothetical protein
MCGKCVVECFGEVVLLSPGESGFDDADIPVVLRPTPVTSVLPEVVIARDATRSDGCTLVWRSFALVMLGNRVVVSDRLTTTTTTSAFFSSCVPGSGLLSAARKARSWDDVA